MEIAVIAVMPRVCFPITGTRVLGWGAAGSSRCDCLRPPRRAQCLPKQVTIVMKFVILFGLLPAKAHCSVTQKLFQCVESLKGKFRFLHCGVEWVSRWQWAGRPDFGGAEGIAPFHLDFSWTGAPTKEGHGRPLKQNPCASTPLVYFHWSYFCYLSKCVTTHLVNPTCCVTVHCSLLSGKRSSLPKIQMHAFIIVHHNDRDILNDWPFCHGNCDKIWYVIIASATSAA